MVLGLLVSTAVHKYKYDNMDATQRDKWKARMLTADTTGDFAKLFFGWMQLSNYRILDSLLTNGFSKNLESASCQ